MIDLTVTEIVPEAEYSGTTYTQTVLCRLPDGNTLSVFDTTPLVVSQDAVQQEIRATLLGRSYQGTVTEAEPRHIEPLGDDEYRYEGEVRGVCTVGKAEITAICLDVGIGSVHIQPDPDIEELLEAGEIRPGTDLSVDTYMTDIVDYDGR